MSVHEEYSSDNREVYKLTPGIVDAVDQHQGDTLRAKHLDLPYENTKIGAALNVLAEENYLEPLQTNGRRANLYAKKTEDFTEARTDADQLFRKRINNAFKLPSQDINQILEDLEQKGVHTVEYPNEYAELAKFRNNDYNIETLNFLDQLNIIKDPETRRITAPKTDINILEDQLPIIRDEL